MSASFKVYQKAQKHGAFDALILVSSYLAWPCSFKEWRFSAGIQECAKTHHQANFHKIRVRHR